MPSSNWKKVELKKCRALGGERTGPTGRNLPDCKGTPFIGLEVKAYKRLVFLTEDWHQAVQNASKLGVEPVLNVREGGRGGRDVVQLWASTLSRLTDAAGIPLERYYSPMQAAQLDIYGGVLVRIEWSEFVQLYTAFINEIDRQVEEDLIGN